MEYMTLQEVAQLFKVSKSTVYRWLREEKIKALKVGRKWLFDREYVEKLARQPTK